MQQSRVRFTLRRMMAVVGIIAVLLVLLPSLLSGVGGHIWHGHIPFSLGSHLAVDLIVEPRLDLIVVPMLSLVVALNKPQRIAVWTAIAVDLLSVVSWLLIRRFMGVGTGSALIWPDSFISCLQGKLPDLRLMSAPFHRFFEPSTVGEMADLLALFVLSCLLGSLLLPRPLPHRLRVIGVLAATAFPCGEWIARMWSDRYFGFGKPSFRYIGPGGYYLSRPTVVDLVQGSLFAVLLACFLTAWACPRWRSRRENW